MTAALAAFISKWTGALDLDYLEERIDAMLRRGSLRTPVDLALVSAVIAELRAARQDDEVEDDGS